MQEKQLLELGKSVRKQLNKKNAKHQITRFGLLVTDQVDDKLSVDYFMKLINGYELNVDLQPLAEVINTDEIHAALQLVLGGMLSE